MNVREVAMEDGVQDPGRHRCPEVLVQRRHCPWLDVAAETRAHHELRTRVELSDERRELTKVVSAVAITHQDELSANVWERILIGTAEPTLGGLQNASAVRERDLTSQILATVDD